MSLTFDSVVDLTTEHPLPAPAFVRSLMFINEPNNDLNQFYIYNERAGDKNTHITQEGYEDLAWSGPYMHLTGQCVKRIGLKNFPQLGAAAFVNLKYGARSFLLCPVFITRGRLAQPGFTVTQNTGSLTFHMSQPADSDTEYVCWRIVLRIGDTAFEYISYEETLTVDNPYLTGTYDCYCVGYVGEGQSISEDSEHYTLNITGSGADPLDKFEYYTKKEVDAKVPQLLTVTLAASAWTGAAAPYVCTVTVPGVTPTGYAYRASPASSDWSAYSQAGVYLDDPATPNSLTFFAISEKPTTDLVVNILKTTVRST